MNPGVQPFIASFAFTDRGVRLVTDDISAAEALYRVRDGDGASILWTLGHLYDYRCMALGALGIEVDREYEAMFSDAPASEGSEYPSLKEVLTKWYALAEILAETLGNVADDALITAEGERTQLFNALNFYAWHEASHMGAVNMIRKELGLLSASEVVIARMRKAREEAEAKKAEAGES